MSDQTPDPTALDDDQLDNLLDRLAERANERDDLDLPGSGPSRRTVLATLLGAGGLGVGATQLGAAASWGSASGTVGTNAEPVDQANIRDLDIKLLETQQLTATETLTDVVLLNSQTISTGTATTVAYDTSRADELNAFDATNHEITIPSDGRYLITGYGTWADDAGWTTGDQCRLRPVVNGSSVVFGTRLKISANQEGVQIPTVVENLSAGDKVTVEAFQNSGADKVLLNGEDVQRLMVARIG